MTRLRPETGHVTQLAIDTSNISCSPDFQHNLYGSAGLQLALKTMSQLLADLIPLVHFAFVLFIVGGQIPGALNRFYKCNLDTNGCFKSAAELREEFSDLIGAHAAQNILHQCGSGVTACHNLQAMEIAGLPGSRLYPGSWSEWVADPGRPVERRYPDQGRRAGSSDSSG